MGGSCGSFVGGDARWLNGLVGATIKGLIVDDIFLQIVGRGRIPSLILDRGLGATVSSLIFAVITSSTCTNDYMDRF